MSHPANNSLFLATLVYINDGKNIETFTEVCSTRATAEFFIAQCTHTQKDENAPRCVASITEIENLGGDIRRATKAFNSCKVIA
jgi:hypothetical protein